MSALRERLRRPPWGGIVYLVAAAAYVSAALRPLSRPILDLASGGRWAYALGALALMLGQATVLDRLAAALALLDRT